MNFYPSGPDDGGFVVVPKSANLINASFEKYDDMASKRSLDYVRMFPDDLFWTEAARDVQRDASNKYDYLPVKMVLEPGDFLLWDSRSIHCNHPATRPSSDPNAKTHLKRLVAYICMTPASSAQDIDTVVKYRMHAFQYGITTTHWPHEYRGWWATAKKIPTAGASVIKLTPEQTKLITGNNHHFNVYDEKITESLRLDAA